MGAELPPPPHVPADLVRSFDFFEDLQPGAVYLNLKRLHEGPVISSGQSHALLSVHLSWPSNPTEKSVHTTN